MSSLFEFGDKLNREGDISARLAVLSSAASHLDWIAPKTSVNTMRIPDASTFFKPVVSLDTNLSTADNSAPSSVNQVPQSNANTYYAPINPDVPESPTTYASYEVATPAEPETLEDLVKKRLRQEIANLHNETDPNVAIDQRMGDY
ncbi:MAG: hypothetical protein WDN66_03985 [Candidatus Saccharibacteria bacterium]